MVKIKFLSIIILSMVLIYCTGCNGPNSDNNLLLDNDANEVISNYVINYNIGKFYKSDKQFEVHKIYGIDETNELINVYMYSHFQGYSFIDNSFKLMSGQSCPALISLKKQNNQYAVVNFQLPQDGQEYGNSITRMFPRKYASMALHDTEDKKLLSSEMREKIKAWLNLQGKDVEIVEW